MRPLCQTADGRERERRKYMEMKARGAEYERLRRQNQSNLRFKRD